MRQLIISVVSLALLMGAWGIFYSYSDKTLNEIIDSCEGTVMSAMKEDDWDTAGSEFVKQYDKWHNYKKKALLILDTSDINSADYSFARAREYIEAEDLSNSSGELLSLKEMLKTLYEKEKVTIYNIL